MSAPLLMVFALCKSALRDRQMVISTIFMVVLGVGFFSLVRALNWAVLKEPIPWPAGVQVSDDFRLVSLPEQLGEYHLGGDGEMIRDPNTGQPILDGKPDGEIISTEENRLTLEVGTKFDAPHKPRRMSNWYVQRYYIHNEPRQAIIPAWVLHVVYYTGEVGQVAGAHVPDRCMAAAGARPVPDGNYDVAFDVPESGRMWRPKVLFNRREFSTVGENGLNRQLVQYYTFNLNGKCEPNWVSVRLNLQNPAFSRYACYAKIQIMPAGNTNELDRKTVDREAQKFLDSVLPAVLETLPSEEEVDQYVKSQAKSKDK